MCPWLCRLLVSFFLDSAGSWSQNSKEIFVNREPFFVFANSDFQIRRSSDISRIAKHGSMVANWVLQNSAALLPTLAFVKHVMKSPDFRVITDPYMYRARIKFIADWLYLTRHQLKRCRKYDNRAGSFLPILSLSLSLIYRSIRRGPSSCSSYLYRRQPWKENFHIKHPNYCLRR